MHKTNGYTSLKKSPPVLHIFTKKFIPCINQNSSKLFPEAYLA